MATLTVELEDSLLARAEDLARRRGTDLKSEIVAHVTTMTSVAERQLAAVERMTALSKSYPGYIEGGMPSRDERNAR